MWVELFFMSIWIGGAFADPDEKRGFWNRFCWPCDIGEWIYFKMKG